MVEFAQQFDVHADAGHDRQAVRAFHRIVDIDRARRVKRKCRSPACDAVAVVAGEFVFRDNSDLVMLVRDGV